MGLVEDITAKLDAAAGSIAGIGVDVTSLKDQIEALILAGSGATTEELHGLLDKASAIADSAAALDLTTP